MLVSGDGRLLKNVLSAVGRDRGVQHPKIGGVKPPEHAWEVLAGHKHELDSLRSQRCWLVQKNAGSLRF